MSELKAAAYFAFFAVVTYFYGPMAWHGFLGAAIGISIVGMLKFIYEV